LRERATCTHRGLGGGAGSPRAAGADRRGGAGGAQRGLRDPVRAAQLPRRQPGAVRRRSGADHACRSHRREGGPPMTTDTFTEITEGDWKTLATTEITHLTD